MTSRPTKTRSRYLLWYGRDEPPAETRELRAGPLTAALEGPDLRYVRLGGLEVLRRLYVAVRDHDWETIPGVLSGFEVDAGADSFAVRFEAHHRRGDINFRWRGTISGSPAGEITYALDGVAGSNFRYNRIGLCLLHPPSSAGRLYLGRTPEGQRSGNLPLRIGPQRIEDGRICALFPAFDALSIRVSDEVWADFQLQGDLFEMEDQRNWTDASFKTYSTPLSLPYPHQARAGQEIRQRVALSLSGSPEDVAPAGAGELRVSLGQPLGRSLPPIGLGLGSHEGPLAAREVELLRKLRPDHLRADLRLGDPGYRGELERGAQAAVALGAKLELALHLGEEPEAELAAFAPLLEPLGARVARLLVFREGEPVTAGRWVGLARELLRAAAPGAAFGGGTNVYFTDLNRFRPELEPLDEVAYSINPQVHAFDEASLVETLQAQGETVRSARAFCGDRALVVSPVTLRPRFNPNAIGPEPEPGPGELPSQVDPRQASLFGAVWTAGSVKYLAESGADSLTYYETTGRRGVLETEADPPLPERFPSEPGMVFPLYHVLADLGEWKGGELVGSRSSDPLRLEALAVQAGGELRLLVANMTHEAQRCVIEPLPVGSATVRILDEDSAARALAEPECFRGESELRESADGRLALELAPYALVRIDLRRPPGEGA